MPQLCSACAEEEHEVPFGAATMVVNIYSFGIVLWEIIPGDSPQAANGRLRVPGCSSDAKPLNRLPGSCLHVWIVPDAQKMAILPFPLNASEETWCQLGVVRAPSSGSVMQIQRTPNLVVDGSV